MINRIVVVNGLPRSGKDEFIKYSSEVLMNDFKEMSINIPIMSVYKEIASKYFGYDEDIKRDKDRLFLNKLMRVADECYDYTFKNIISSIQQTKLIVTDYPINVFTCIRNPDIIYRLRDYCKEVYPDTLFKAVLIERNDSKEGSNDDDKLDTIMKYEYDYTIHNDDSQEEYHLLIKGYWNLEKSLELVSERANK